MFEYSQELEIVKAFGEAASSVRDAMRHYVQRQLRKQNIDLTFEMVQVIIALMERGHQNQQEIANYLRKDKASLTYIIDNLSKRGLVVRVEDQQDKRNKIIHFTEDGIALQEKLQHIIRDLYQAARNGLSSDSFARITKSLMNVTKNLDKS